YFQRLRRGFVAADSRQIWAAEMRPAYEAALGVLHLAYQVTGDRHWLARAWQMADHSRGLLLRDALQEGIARLAGGLPPALRQQEADLADSLAAAEKAVFDLLNLTSDSALTALRRQKNRVFNWRQAYQSLIQRLEADYPAYVQLKYSDPSPGLPALRQSLQGPQDALIAFFAGDTSLFVLGLTPAAESFEHVPIDDTLIGALAELRGHLTNRQEAESRGHDATLRARIAQLSHALFLRLLEPSAQTLGLRFEPADNPPALTLIPDGWLGYLPFEVLLPRLPGPDLPDYGSFPYLLRYRQIQYAYASHLALAPASDRPAPRLYLGMAPDYGDASLTRLQSHLPEIQATRSLMQGRAWLGREASEGLFREQAPHYRILHLAMHTVLDEQDARYSFLAFAKPRDSTMADKNDGRLHAYEIAQLDLSAELAVLSACGTGQGPLLRGEGVMSLARAFRLAGCAHLVMSLWEADDQATARLMETFFRYLKEGHGKSAALRQARLDYLAQSAYRHPAYWAAFVLVGDNQSVPMPGPRWPWWVGGGLLLLGLGYFFWKRATTRSG
ncbi:MAG: CHAT domain-containing protein, partial [Bacteroidetes bacterium]